MFDLNFPFDLLSECDYLNLDIIGNRVRNKVIFSNDDFIIMAVIGPNKRSDYHVNSKQEFFYQIRGQLKLEVLQNSQIKTVEVNEGCCYILEKDIPHRPVRESNSIGIVIESARRGSDKDSLLWLCPHCNKTLHEISFSINRIDRDIEATILNFEESNKELFCNLCAKIVNIKKIS